MDISIEDIKNKLIGIDYSHLSESEARHKHTEIEMKLKAIQSGESGLGFVERKHMIEKLKKRRDWIEDEFDI